MQYVVPYQARLNRLRGRVHPSHHEGLTLVAARTPGRVPHVRPSVHGLNTMFFECFYFICHSVIVK
jgi:hypothetical protein